VYLNFYDKLLIEVANDRGKISSYLRDEYKHYICPSPGSAGAGSVCALNILSEITAGPLYFIGREAAFDDSSFYIIDRARRKFRVDFDELLSGNELVVEENFDPHLFGCIFRSIVLLKLCMAGFIPVHSSSVVYNSSGILMPGWGGTGKTRMLLKFIGSGGEFVSDEWTFLNRNRLFTYTRDFEMLYYDMREFPGLAGLSLIERLRLKPEFLYRDDRLGRAFSHLRIPLKSRKYDLRKFFPTISDRAGLHKILFLQNHRNGVPGIKPVASETLTERIYLSFLRENQSFFYYHNLFKYAGFKKADDLETAIGKRYMASLSDEIKDKECFLLSIPLNISYSDIDLDRLLP